MSERWLPIPGWEASYEVSDHGRVRSVDRVVTYRDGRTRRYPSRILAPAINRENGYGYVVLSSPSKQRTFTTHKLLMLAFAGPCPPGLEIRHLDGDSAHTTLSNLSYGTRSENMLDRVRHGTHNNANKTHCPNRHLYDTENTLLWASDRRRARRCRTCERARDRRRKQERKAALGGAAVDPVPFFTSHGVPLH